MTQWLNSPNFTPGRQGAAIDRVVIHWMDGDIASADSTFSRYDPVKGTSAHYGVENETIHQYVKEQDTAWHSGNFSMNLRSIGVEHSAQPGRDASQATMEASAHLIADICKRYSISVDRTHIIRHKEVVPTECPGTVDIDWLINRAKQISEGDNMAEVATLRVKQILFYGIVGRKGFNFKDPAKYPNAKRTQNALAGESDSDLNGNHPKMELTNQAIEDLWAAKESIGNNEDFLGFVSRANAALGAAQKPQKDLTDQDKANLESLWDSIGKILDKEPK